MNLVEQNELARLIHLDKVGLQALARPIMKILKLHDVNQVYQSLEELQGPAFIDALLEEYEVNFEYYAAELKNIPKTGPFITVSNHPLGGIDGLLLLKLLNTVRPDFKVMANFLLQKVEPIKDYVMPVNPFETKNVKSSYGGIKEAMRHVQAGHGLGIFPAGEVSTYQFEEKRITDKAWEDGAIKLIEKLGVPVVPIYFKARNSAFFYLLSILHPGLRTAKLPSELRQQKNKAVKIRIGRPIYPKELAGYKTTPHLKAFLRQRTYLLREALPPAKKLFSLKRPVHPLPFQEAVPAERLKAEIQALRTKERRLIEQKSYEVFCASSEEIPQLLLELGRLRELTFRAIGEGTNRALDLDDFDFHYRHLLLWDKETEQLAGAYRLGIGPEIYERFGINGFYVSTLFKIKKGGRLLLQQGLEMGRAFVVPEHQQKPLPLFLLWQGIEAVLAAHPNLKYICGCASISNVFSKFSQSLMVEFFLKNHGDANLTQFIKPRKAFKPKLKSKYQHQILNSTKSDLTQFDRIIENLEPGNLRVPVLIKKYLKLNARFVCFNVDPLFNNSLDGFMYIAVQDLEARNN